MWQVVKEHPRAFVYAVLAHLALVGMLIFSLDWTAKPTPAGGAKPEPVQAIVIDESKVSAELERIQEAERRKQQQEAEAAERLRELEEKTRQAEAAHAKEQRRLDELKQKQVQEEKRLQEQEAKRKIEQQKQAAEAKRLEEQKKQKQAEEKRLAETEAKRKLEAEAKRKAEAEAKAKAEEAKRKAEAEAKRKAEEAAQRKAAEDALQQQLAAERAALEAARNADIISRYVGIIGQQVERNWIRPPTSQSGLSCVVQVRLVPGGDVVSVQVVQGSGDAAFDRSVEAAVYRAAPLPLPPDPGLFESFRTLQFRFAPE